MPRPAKYYIGPNLSSQVIPFHPAAYSPPSGLSTQNDAITTTNNTFGPLTRYEYAAPSYVARSNITVHSIAAMRIGRLLMIPITFSVSANLTHGAGIVAISGYGYPTVENTPFSVVANNGGVPAVVRPGKTGSASIELTANGAITAGSYYTGTVFAIIDA